MAKPTRSPITPPPSATTWSPRSTPSSSSRSVSASSCAQLFGALAGREDDRLARHARCGERRLQAWRDAAVTFSSVTIAIVRPRANSASQVPARPSSPASTIDVVTAVAERDRDVGHQVERLQDRVDGRFVRRVMAWHTDRCQRVDRVADLGQLVERLARIAAAQQRAGVAPPDPVGEHRGIGIEPDRQRRFEDQRARLVVDEGAAAGRDHLGRAVDQPGDHAALPVAEMRLAEALEDIGDRHAGRRLDLLIGIDKGQPHPLRPAGGRRSICPRPSGRSARSGGRSSPVRGVCV